MKPSDWDQINFNVVNLSYRGNLSYIFLNREI